MPVLYGILFAVLVVGIGALMKWLIGFAVTSTFRIRPFRRWLRSHLIQSHGCRRMSRRMGSSLLD